MMAQGFINFSLGADQNQAGGCSIPLPPCDAPSLLSTKESTLHLLGGLSSKLFSQITNDPKEYRKNGRDYIIPCHHIKGKGGMFFVPALYTPLEKTVRVDDWAAFGTGVKKESLQAYFAAPMEMDDGTLDDQWARLMGLPEHLRPSLICFSGNKSLHSFWALTTPASPDEMTEILYALQKLLGGDKALTRAGQRARLPGYSHNDRKQPVIYHAKRYFSPSDLTKQLLALVEERNPDAFLDLKAQVFHAKKTGGKMPCRFFPPKGELYEAFLSAHKAGGTTSYKISPNGDLVKGGGANRKTSMKDKTLMVTDFSPDGSEVYIFSDKVVKREALAVSEDLTFKGMPAPAPLPKAEEDYYLAARNCFERFFASECIRLAPKTIDFDTLLPFETQDPDQFESLLPSDFFGSIAGTLTPEQRKPCETSCHRGIFVIYRKSEFVGAETRTPCWSHNCEHCHPSLSAATLLGARAYLTWAKAKGLICHTSASNNKAMASNLARFCRENPGSFYLWLNINGEFRNFLFTPKGFDGDLPSGLDHMLYNSALSFLLESTCEISRDPEAKRFRMIGGSSDQLKEIIIMRNGLIGRGPPQAKTAFPKGDEIKTTLFLRAPINLRHGEDLLQTSFRVETKSLKGGGWTRTFTLPIPYDDFVAVGRGREWFDVVRTPSQVEDFAELNSLSTV